MNEWKYWGGYFDWTGPLDAVVDIKTGDGRILRNQIAGYLDWTSTGMTNSIIAYRILKCQMS